MSTKEQQIVDLEIERRALLETVYQLGKGDARMETGLNDLCRSLEKKAEEINRAIAQLVRAQS